MVLVLGGASKGNRNPYYLTTPFVDEITNDVGGKDLNEVGE
jgi:hypothetical protein